jgi:hypothetical protein
MYTFIWDIKRGEKYFKKYIFIVGVRVRLLLLYGRLGLESG